MNRPFPLTLMLGATVALLATCSSPPQRPAAAPTAAPVPAAQSAPAPAAAPAASPAATAAQANTNSSTLHLDAQSLISTQRKVYFDFDDATLKSESTPLLERHGRYLLANPALAIRVEGNTDQRGSAEYNLALGQKRAQAVVQALLVYGVKTTQLEAVSWGEERPDVPGSDEQAWAQNRRAELRYPSR